MMLSSMLRSGGISEMEQRASPSALRPEKVSLFSPSKSSMSIERKSSIKVASFPKEQEQEIREASEEKKEMKKSASSTRGESDDDARIKLLERELNRVKESESKMLESLMSQTKQLEETKIELEEAKLEIRTLQETIKDMENPACSRNRDLEKLPDKSNGFDLVHAQKEIAQLKNELKLALGAEEKSKKAMDDLAAALKEVAAESNQAKEKLSVAHAELLDTSAGAEYTKTTLKSTEEKLKMAQEEAQRLKMEAEESVLAWNTKQEGFRDCVKLFEEEISRGKKENSKLIETQRALKDEVSKMRDIMKQALNEASVVKEALEIARNENSQLKDALAEKDSTLQRLGQEFESVKVSEAAALGSVEGLKNLLAATSNFEPSKTVASASFDNINGTSARAEAAVAETTKEPKKAEDAWPGLGDSVGEGHRFSIGYHKKRSESLRYPPIAGETDDSVDGKPLRPLASFSAVSVRGPARPASNDASDIFDDDGFDDKSMTYSGVMRSGHASPTTRNRKKPMLRKFTDMWRRKSISK